MLKAIREELSSDPEIQMVGELTYGYELTKVVREKQPDVLILDLGISGENFEPLTIVHHLTQSYPKLRILILTGYDDPLLMRSLISAGALGYTLKSDDLSLELPRAVRVIYTGQPFYSDQVVHKLMLTQTQHALNDQELFTLRLIANGLSNDEIGTSMLLSEKRVRNIVSTIYSKLEVSEEKGVNQRVACINRARELGLLMEK